MNASDYQAKRALLKQYEAMLKSPAFAEFKVKIQAEHDNCLAGLRNRKITIYERQEYQEGADATERLLKFAEERVTSLTKETSLSSEELESFRNEFEPEPEG